MRILALDASTQALSVAVFDSGEQGIAHEHFEVAARAHASRLLPAAQRLLAEAGWTLSSLDGFAFGRGPGAFTGLRIAAGLIQGLAAGTDRPVVPISTLAALAARGLEQDEARTEVRVVQDARMGEIYTADYRRGAQAPALIGDERVIEPDALAQEEETGVVARAGNGWMLVARARGLADDTFEIAAYHPHALDMAMLAAPLLWRGQGVTAAKALPVYVRDDVARKPAR